MFIYETNGLISTKYDMRDNTLGMIPSCKYLFICLTSMS